MLGKKAMDNFPGDLPEHSPLGASGSYRWLPEPYGGDCTASVGLSPAMEDPESEYAAEGTAAHTLAAACLNKGDDAWHRIGARIFGKDLIYSPSEGLNKGAILVTKEMADAVQVFLDDVRKRYPNQQINKSSATNTYVEYFFYRPELHPLFYGQADFVFVDYANRVLHVHDYKHGAGIVVDVQRNPQCMYYGVGVIEKHLHSISHFFSHEDRSFI